MFIVTNHPAQAKDANGEPMLDNNGQPVPLFPDARAVRVKQDNRIVAYVSFRPDGSHNVSVIARPGSYMQNLPDAVEKFVAQEFKTTGKVSSAAEVDIAVKAVSQSDDDEDYDDD